MPVSACIRRRPARTKNRTVFYEWRAGATFSFPKCQLNGWKLTPCSKKCCKTATKAKQKNPVQNGTVAHFKSQTQWQLSANCLLCIQSFTQQAACDSVNAICLLSHTEQWCLTWAKREGRRNKARRYQNTIVSCVSEEYASRCFILSVFFFYCDKKNN